MNTFAPIESSLSLSDIFDVKHLEPRNFSNCTTSQWNVSSSRKSAILEPNPYAVLIGRGKICSNAVGNRRLNIIASRFLKPYSLATSKQEKTEIVSQIVKIIEDSCPTAAFIKKSDSDGLWYPVDQTKAREKVGYVMRDLLHDNYKSSTKAKVEKRRRQREARRSSTSSNVSSSSSVSESSSTSDCASEQFNPLQGIQIIIPPRDDIFKITIPQK